MSERQPWPKSALISPEQLDDERWVVLDLLAASHRILSPAAMAMHLVLLARHYSGCEAVAMRLREGPDFPYAASHGFPPEFLQRESRLCTTLADGHIRRDAKGRPLLGCLCGRLLDGNLAGFEAWLTSQGSFITRSDRDGLPAEAVPQGLRNNCLLMGYQTMGLFPIRLDGVTYGLLQCSDQRPGQLSPQRVNLLEALSRVAALQFEQAGL